MFFSNTKNKKKLTWTLVAASIIVLSATVIRLIGLMHTPPSLYWEEVALGYDAYSLMKTGMDHHGNSWPIVAVESFGDWKPSLYFYALIPFIKLLGLQPWVVRLPSALAGIFTVICIGLLTKKIAENFSLKDSNLYGLLGLFIGSISPWAIHFSRGGWEVNLATMLVTAGITVGIFALNNDKKTKLSTIHVISSALLLVLAVYTYHGTRLSAPLIGIGLALYWSLPFLNNKKVDFKKLISLPIAGLLAVVLMLPLLISLRSPQVTQRFAETSIFSSLSVIEESNANKELANNSFLSKLMYHRYLLFSREVLSSYLSHFNFDFLFISGDSNPRHSSQYGGHLYYQEALFLIIGIGFILYKRKPSGWLILAWWLIAVLPAALTKTTPHALRILPAMPAILIIVSLGLGISLNTLTKFFKNHLLYIKAPSSLIIFIGIAMYLASFSMWWRHYWSVYPLQQSHEWQFGYEEMISEINMAKHLHNIPIFITRKQGRPAMYYWFFSKTDPQLVQEENDTAEKDQGEFLSFQNIRFPNTVNEIAIPQEGALVASSANGPVFFEEKGYSIERLSEINNKLDQSVWQIYIVRP